MVYLSEQKIKVGVIGLGKMGILHSSILNTLPNVELLALCDKSNLIRKVCKKIFVGRHIVDDIAKLSGLDLDIVYITTPIPSHFVVTQNIYSNNIANNLFIEKPLASNYHEASKLSELVKNFGGLNIVGYMKRFAVTFRKAKELLNIGKLGELVNFEAYAYSSDFFGSDKTSKACIARGGMLRDLGAHVIDLALWFFDDLEVDYTTGDQTMDFSSGDCLEFNVRRSDGLKGQFSVSWFKEKYRMPEFGLEIKGSEGTLSVTDDQVKLMINDSDPECWYRHDLKDNVGFQLGGPEYYREDEYFIDAVLNNKVVSPNFETAAKVDYLIDCVTSRSATND